MPGEFELEFAALFAQAATCLSSEATACLDRPGPRAARYGGVGLAVTLRRPGQGAAQTQARSQISVSHFVR